MSLPAMLVLRTSMPDTSIVCLPSSFPLITLIADVLLSWQCTPPSGYSTRVFMANGIVCAQAGSQDYDHRLC
jgi:hypothetical protein